MEATKYGSLRRRQRTHKARQCPPDETQCKRQPEMSKQASNSENSGPKYNAIPSCPGSINIHSSSPFSCLGTREQINETLNKTRSGTKGEKVVLEGERVPHKDEK